MNLIRLLTIKKIVMYTFYSFTIQLLLCTMLLASEKSNAQQTMSVKEVNISINFANDNLLAAFDKIERLSEFSFVFDKNDLDRQIKLSGKYDEDALYDVLLDISRKSGLTFKQVNNNINVQKQNTNNSSGRIEIEISEDADISGTVTDENGLGLPGATVVVKGTELGTITDMDGKFNLSVPSDAVLTISFVGYFTKEIAVGSQTVINVSMELDAEQLEEIVVIGYGTQKRSDLTGAVGSVSEEKLKERPATSLNQALAGKIAGVQVNTNSGRPGGKSNVRIRGFSSINSSNNPLYVIDGVQLPQGNQAQFTSAIDYLNPNDVVSIEVLKDASSTAIYGARGANGVILITTKKGKAGKGMVTYDVDFSVPKLGPNRVDVLNSEEYAMIEQLSWENTEKFDPAGWASGKYAQYEPRLKREDPKMAGLFDSAGKPLYDTDWAEEITQHKLSQNHQLGFSGGNESTTYSLSLGYRDDQGLLLNSYLKRYSGRLSIDDQIKPWLKIGGSLSYNSQTENLVDTNDQVPRRMVEDYPFLPVKYESGPLEGQFANNRDYPYAEGTRSSAHWLHANKYILNTQTSSGSAYSNIRFAEGLIMRTVIGTNVMTQERNSFRAGTLDSNAIARAASSNRKQSFWSVENYLTYNKTINDIHSFSGLLGLSWQESNNFYVNSSSRNFPTDYFEYNNLGAGADRLQVGTSASRHALNSYFGRINYNLMDKYLLTVTGRADGSSKFGDNNKFAFFPSAALAWRVSEEDFLSSSDKVSNLKLRASFGLTGNSEIPPYSSLSLLGSGYKTSWNNTAIGGTGLYRLANPDLRWEKTTQTDIGVELGLFNNRITFEADYYFRKTTDMLLDAPVPQSSGYATIRKNVGSMQNQGVELSLNTVNITTSDVTWNSSFSISMNKNKVLSLATPSDIFGVGGGNFTNPTNIIRIGEPVGSFWGLTRLGTWGTDEADEAAKYVSYRNGLTILPGDVKYLDVNGDYIINDEDRSIIGNGSPKAWGAFTNYFSYKNLDVTIELQYSIGNDVMNMNLHPSEDRQALANSYRTVLNAWTPENQNTMIAQVRDTRAGYVTNVDSHWIQDASFIRGRNLMLGYTFRQNTLDKLTLSKLRVYTSVQNLFLIVNDELLGDPEVSPSRGNSGNNVFSQGMMWHEYPKPTTFMVGLQIGL